MAPAHASKGGLRYRYYVSSTLTQGQAARAGSRRPVAAPELE